MDIMTWIWIALIVVTAVIEFTTVQMVSIWFSFGALVGLLTALLSGPIWLQIVLFVVVSGALLLLLRTISLKWLLRNINGKTNSDLLIGRKIKLITPITKDELGSAKLNDVTWNVAGDGDFTADAGEYVTIIQIKGNRLIVSKGE